MQNAEHHRERFELAYATEWAKAREGDETPERLAAEVKSWRVGDTYEAAFQRLRFGWEGYQWALAGRQCLAQIQEPAQPVCWVRFCSDGSTEGPIMHSQICEARKTSGAWTPLYAGAAPAAVAPQDERQWICPTRTVADLVNNLLTMDQALPIYGAQYIERDGRRCAIAVPPTVSRERVKDGRWIGQGEELNATVVWTRAEQPAAAPGLTDGQLDDESYRVNDEPGFSDAFRAGARFAERVHGVTASAARAVTGKADWWRGRADEIEVQVARSGSQEAMRCYTDMRTLLQAAAPALEAPAAPGVPDGWNLMPTKATSDMLYAMAECDGYKRGDRDHPGLTRWEDYWHMALAAAPQAPAAPDDPMDWPLPYDVTVGHGTIRKGCKLRTLVLRMQVLYDLSQKAALAMPVVGAPAWIDAKRQVPEESDGEVFVRFSDGSIGTAWATYWHGASNDFAEWSHPDPDEDRVVAYWMKPAPLAAQAAPTVDASDTALLDAMQQHRIALVPEFEGPWDAEIYNDDAEAQPIASGNTPREALRAAIAAQAKEGGESC